MIIPWLLLIGIIVAMPLQPRFYSPYQIADWTGCDPYKIAYSVGQSIEYKEQIGWDDSDTCLERGSGDCKCHARVAKDTLMACVGYDAKIQILRHNNKRHAVVLFTDHKGNRGYIDSSNASIFSPGTDWNEVISDIGGKWEAE